MQQRDGDILFSPSDLNAFLECEHLTQLELLVARHELERPTDENPQADLVKRKGDEHEAAYLARLIAEGRDVVTIPNDWDLDAAALATEEAMHAGADVIYQACFVDGDWRGFADFVERQPDGRYEVVAARIRPPLSHQEVESRACKLHKRLHTPCTCDEEHVALNGKSP